MPIRQNRPFKAPRQAKSKVVTKDSDDGDIPISQTIAKTNQTFVHRKDNSKWGKEMEKKLGEIEKRSEASVKEVETSVIPLLTAMQSDGFMTKSTKRQSVFRRDTIPRPIIADIDETSKHSQEVGKKSS